MIRGFWVPTNWKRGVLLLAVIVLVVLRQSELVGLMNSTVLVFGWLPAQLAYDIAIGVVASVLGYLIFREAPEPPEEFDPTVGSRKGSVETGGED